MAGVVAGKRPARRRQPLRRRSPVPIWSAYDLSWAAGFLRNAGLEYTVAEAIGHSGWGGSCAFAEPSRRLSGAYVNRQSAELILDPRSRRLIEALYAAF